MTALTNTSIFQGIIEFTDNSGDQYRCEGRKVSKLSDGAWIHIGLTPGKKILVSPKAIWNAMQDDAE